MSKKRQLYLNKVTKQGQEDNLCPNCDGDGVFVDDYEQGQAVISVDPCGLCDATGIAIIGKDYKIDVDYTENGPIHQIIPIFKSK